MATKKMCFEDLFNWVYDVKNIDKPEFADRRRELMSIMIKREIREKMRNFKRYCGVTMYSVSSKYNLESLKFGV